MATIPKTIDELIGLLLALLANQVDYKETGTNITKYNRYFDVEAWQFFNTKKQGAQWCATFVIWAFVQVLLPIFGGSFAKIRDWFGMPKPALNEAAGCKQFWTYMNNKGWQVAKSAGRVGDIIFFGDCGHVGIIIGVDSKNYYTEEGNKKDKVSKCTYSKSDKYIYGIMHPDWAAIEKLLPKDPEPQPAPEPAPEPTPDPEITDYEVVNIRTFLAIRNTPEVKSDDSNKVGELKNGAIVSVFETRSGWARIGGEMWVSLKYLKKV